MFGDTFRDIQLNFEKQIKTTLRGHGLIMRQWAPVHRNAKGPTSSPTQEHASVLHLFVVLIHLFVIYFLPLCAHFVTFLSFCVSLELFCVVL